MTEFGENTALRSSDSPEGRMYSKPEVVTSAHPSGGEGWPSEALSPSAQAASAASAQPTWDGGKWNALASTSATLPRKTTGRSRLSPQTPQIRLSAHWVTLRLSRPRSPMLANGRSSRATAVTRSPSRSSHRSPYDGPAGPRSSGGRGGPRGSPGSRDGSEP